jgi:hypothetical protein
MKCPKCGSLNVYVLDTYNVDDGSTQKRKCRDCGIAITTITAIVNVEPSRGEGAAALAKQIKKAPNGALGIISQKSSYFPVPAEKQGSGDREGPANLPAGE